MAIMAFIIDAEKNILLLQRKDRDQREPVKGGSEDGETPEEWILRELKEETWIAKSDIKSIKFLEEFDEHIKFEDYAIDIHTFLFIIHIDWIKPKITINFDTSGGEDHKDYKRVSMNELENIKIFTPYANNYKMKIQNL